MLGRTVAAAGGVLALVAVLSAAPQNTATANRRNQERDGRYCSRTARSVFLACGYRTSSDYLIATAICINVSDPVRRAACFDDARASRQDGNELCRAQREGRLAACKLL